jgi:hypothetical protein
MAHRSDKVLSEARGKVLSEAKGRESILSEAKGKKDSLDPLAREDDLGRMIRWGLEDAFSGAEPPDDVWAKIKLRVQEMRAPAPRAPVRRRPSFSLAPLVQTVVVSVLLLSFALGVDRNVTAPRAEHTVRSTPAVQKVDSIQDTAEDMLSGYMLARMAQQPPTRQRPGGARP